MTSSDYEYYVQSFLNNLKSYEDIMSCIDYEYGWQTRDKVANTMQRKIKSAMNKAGRGHEAMNFEMN